MAMIRQRRANNFRKWPMLSKKSFAGIYENFLKLLMRSMRDDVRDHIASQKNDHGLSYRHYKASQRRSSPKITICEIFGVVRFSTFSTASVKVGRTHSEQMSSGLPLRDGVIGRPSLWIAEDFWVLRFRLMVKRGPW
jgi:hypothetical protein